MVVQEYLIFKRVESVFKIDDDIEICHRKNYSYNMQSLRQVFSVGGRRNIPGPSSKYVSFRQSIVDYKRKKWLYLA